jgi:hypothetical protein
MRVVRSGQAVTEYVVLVGVLAVALVAAVGAYRLALARGLEATLGGGGPVGPLAPETAPETTSATTRTGT